jgi:hypothetical protein
MLVIRFQVLGKEEMCDEAETDKKNQEKEENPFKICFHPSLKEKEKYFSHIPPHHLVISA